MQQRTWPEQSFNFGFFFFWCYGFVGAFPPYITLFFSEKGMTALQIGMLMSIMQFMRIFAPNIWGWTADLLQRRVLVLRFTSAGALIAFVGMFFGDTFMQFAAVMVALNLFTGAQGSQSEALLLAEMRGDLTYYGRLRLWGSVGYIALVSVSGVLLDWHGIRLVPWICWTVLAMAFMASMRFHESPIPPVHRDMPSMGTLLKRREVVAFFTSTGLMIAAHTSLYIFLSLYLAQHGYSKLMIGILWAVGVIAEVVFFFYQAPIFHHFGVRLVMMASLLIAVVRFLMVGFGVESLLVLLVAQVLHAITFGAHHSASVATIQRWFTGPMQTRGQALYASLSYGVGGTFGGLWLSDVWGRFSPQAIYWVAAALAMLAFFVAHLSFRWQAQDGKV